MPFADLTDPNAVQRAIDEFESLGRDEFLRKYSFGQSRAYFLEQDGKLYDSKPIVGAAHGFQFPDLGPLRHEDFSGGDLTVRRKLEELGFHVHLHDNGSSVTFPEVVAEILELQTNWSRNNTPEMKRRGYLIRTAGPQELRKLLSGDSQLQFSPSLEGRDGTGLKTRVPWIRIYSQQRSPSATDGWYVVFLFAADGSAVYLSLNQGTTLPQGGDFRRRSAEYLAERVAWARSHLTQITNGRLQKSIELQDPGGLGEGYEKGNVLAFRYGVDALIDEAQLREDLRTMLQMLSTIYSARNPTSNEQPINDTITVAGSTNIDIALDKRWLREITLWTEADLDDLIDAIQGPSPQIVLAGPPGTGKTWVAQAAARYLTQDDPTRWRLVQFHPSFSYESFVEGLRPVAADGAINFAVVPGVMLRMAELARSGSGLHLIVIDEMNRANLPKVLGELMFLFEYRDRRIDLQYSTEFALPDNLRFLGTMNTADRSIRSIDVALRRRFEVFECLPDVRILERFYDELNHANHVPDLLDGFVALNQALEAELDRHHTIGHTFFMDSMMTPTRLQQVWKRKLEPLIEEYFFDMPDVAARFQVGKFWPSVSST